MRKVTSLLFLFCRCLFATCTATEQNADYGADNGASTTATVTVNVHSAGDLVVFSGYCYVSCTPVSLTMGSQTATQTTVSGTGILDGPGTGQGFIFYILSAAAPGSFTATFAATGANSDIQVAYIDFSTSTGCRFTHDVDYPLGSSGLACEGNNNCGPMNQPAFTPAPGDVLYNFGYTSGHVTGQGSPWLCPVYNGPGETGTCQFATTVQEDAYVLSAPSGPMSVNMTDLHPSDLWQSLVTSFTMTNGPAPNPPTSLTAVAR